MHEPGPERRECLASVLVAEDGTVVVDVVPQVAGSTVVAKERQRGSEVRAAVGGREARLPLALEAPSVWDLFLESPGDPQPSRQRLRVGGGRPCEAGRIGGRTIEPYGTVKGNLSVRVRAPRPRAHVQGVTAKPRGMELTGVLVGLGRDPHAVQVRGVSRYSSAAAATSADLHGNCFTAVIDLVEWYRTGGQRHDTFDVSVVVTAPGAEPIELRLRRPPGAGEQATQTFPVSRVPTSGGDVDGEPYFTASGNLSVRLGAGVPPGTGSVAGARPRRPARPAVRALAEAYFGLVERRGAKARRAGRPALRQLRPRVYFLMRSAYGMGGTVRTVLNTANHLADEGYQVDLISLLRPKETPFFPVHPAIRHTALFDERTRYGAVATLLTSGRLRSLLAREVSKRFDRWESVLTHHREVAFGRSSLWTDLVLVRKLQRLEPGVLVLTRPVLNVVGARLTPPGVRTVGQEHMNFSLHPRTMHAWMLAAYRELDVLTVLTEGDRRDYEDALAGSPVDVVKVPNGLPRLPTVVSDQTAKVIVAAGRLTRQKGFDLLIPAFARVAAEHPDWELRIFGDGAQQPLLQRQIDDLGLSGSVRLMGRTASMAEEMARASIYALSSRFEGFGMVIIEAMSVGLPVVSFDCPRGPSDIITPGSDGLLVPAEDVDALAEGLATLIRDPELRRSMSVTARRTAQNYSMDELGALWKELLRTLGTAVPAHVA